MTTGLAAATGDTPAPPGGAPADEAPRWTVLCVDDEPNILSAIRRVFRATGYRVLLAEGGEQALDVLSRESVHLVISDMRMPVMDGAQLLEQVRYRWPAIARVLLTGYADVGSTVAAINRGEIFRYITKPWNEDDLLRAAREALERQALLHEKARLEAMVARHNDELKLLNASLEQQVAERTAQLSSANARLGKNYLSTIKAFSNLVEMRGGAMAGHSRRVAELGRRMATVMKLPAADIQDVFVAGLMHDIGQVGLSDALLACPVPHMTPEDKAHYLQHTTLGEQALLALDDMQRVAALVRSHHERHDGLGSPAGLRGDAIPVGARILALAEAFDDFQSGHLARAELSASEAHTLIVRGRDTWFESSVVDAFIEATRAPEAPPACVDLPIDQLKPGMALGRDLRSREGVVLLAADHVLTADLIQRIGAHATRHGLSLLIPVQIATVDRRTV
jgi:response regulator RpfG family c-di-GMP phosphodiesterase